MNIPSLICLLADEHCAQSYRLEGLDEQDRCRVAAHPKLALRADWRVSRYLKERAPAPVKSLSHSQGAAAVLCSTAPVFAGVDIETLRERNFEGLAQWVATAAESQYLAQTAWQTEAFYELWTLKESLLKAAGLSFPNDMRRVGWHMVSKGVRKLHVNGEIGWHGLTVKIGDKLMLACVWRGEASLVLHGAEALGELGEVKNW